jgi:hypothetical protein
MASIQYPASDNISWRLYVGTITTIVPATIVVLLRFIARYVAKAGFWWDDYTIVGALVSTQAFSRTQAVQETDSSIKTGNQLGPGSDEMGSDRQLWLGPTLCTGTTRSNPSPGNGMDPGSTDSIYLLISL